MKKSKNIFFTICILITLINIGCNKGKVKWKEGKAKRISKNYNIYESPYGNIFICGEESITNEVDRKVVNIIKEKLIPDREIVDLIVLLDKDKPDDRDYWFISMDKSGRIYHTSMERKGWFDKEGNPLPTKKLIDKYYIKERLEKLANKEIETNIDIIRYYRILRAPPIAKISTNLYLLTQYKIKDLPKIEVPIYITKVSNRPNTNIFIATIGYDHGGEFVPDIKANFYVYEIIKGKAKKVYEDLRCGGDTILKNGLIVREIKNNKLIIYLFTKYNHAYDVKAFVAVNSHRIEIERWQEIERMENISDIIELMHKYNVQDPNPRTSY